MPRFLVAALLLASPFAAMAQDKPAYERKEDVIYGRKFGLCLTMDVFTPKEKNGAGVIFAVSGGWFSSKSSVNPKFLEDFISRGYVVFAVMHGSQPRFSIPEVLEDMHRATRYVKHHAKDYGVDPERIGISGASAGGHLSLMQGCAGKDGDPEARDPVDRQSSKVASVACFFPPTDFLNYGKPGNEALGGGTLKGFKSPFEFVELNKETRSYDVITDQEKRREIGKQISPVYHITAKSAPALMIHGDKDELVPIQQAELVIARMKEHKVLCELVVKPGAAHGWPAIEKDIKILADWHDKHLKK